MIDLTIEQIIGKASESGGSLWAQTLDSVILHQTVCLDSRQTSTAVTTYLKLINYHFCQFSSDLIF